MGLKKATHGMDGLREVVEREHPRDLNGLLAQLREGDAEQRRWAARDLMGFPQAAGFLGARLLDEPATDVREAILTTLKAIASDEAASALLPLLRSEDAMLRNGAIEALTGMPAQVAPRMSALLHDEDPDVRIFTLNLLGDLQHPDIPRWLRDVLANDNEVNVVAAAIEVMSEVGSPEDLPALNAAKRRFAADPFIGFAADMAAQRIEAE
jgi:HEAT repeat protein